MFSKKGKVEESHSWNIVETLNLVASYRIPRELSRMVQLEGTLVFQMRKLEPDVLLENGHSQCMNLGKNAGLTKVL